MIALAREQRHPGRGRRGAVHGVEGPQGSAKCTRGDGGTPGFHLSLGSSHNEDAYSGY